MTLAIAGGYSRQFRSFEFWWVCSFGGFSPREVRSWSVAEVLDCYYTVEAGRLLG